MPDVDGYVVVEGTYGSEGGPDAVPGYGVLVGRGRRHKMRALNSLGTLVTWIAVGDAPDLTASQWVGGNTPLTGVSVAKTWTL